MRIDSFAYLSEFKNIKFLGFEVVPFVIAPY